MSTSLNFRTAPGWYWPDEDDDHLTTGGPSDAGRVPQTEENGNAQSRSKRANYQQSRRSKRYGPRTCRICFDTVNPTFHPPSQNLGGMFLSEPEVTYDSEEGRLLRPCRCKGSSKYVHENCLQTWRHADPSYGRRNYWECPTCGFQYKLARLGWSRMVASASAQIGLTILVLLFATFILGFIADPIISLYLDPYAIILGDDEDYEVVEEEAGWLEHFLKGFASLGLIGFLKAMLANPFGWIRVGGGGGRRAATTGRDRLANVSWFVVMVGIMTFLFSVWQLVRSYCRRVLERAGEKVLDVQPDDDDDDGDDGDDDDDDDDEVPEPAEDGSTAS